MKRRPRRAAGEFVRGDIVVVKSWKFKIGGIKSETERRIGLYVGPLKNTFGQPPYHGVYCPVGGWVFVTHQGLQRATAAQERAFHGKWDRLFQALKGGAR